MSFVASRLLASLKRSYSLVLIVVMQVANDRFLSPVNVGNLLGQMTVMLIVAAGMTIVMIAGEFDVSVGSDKSQRVGVRNHLRRMRRRDQSRS